MAQPHLRPRHFIPLLQSTPRPKSILRQPDWVSSLLDVVCEHIEPLEGEAHVGYELAFTDPIWRLDLFLSRAGENRLSLAGYQENQGADAPRSPGRRRGEENLAGYAECVPFNANIPQILSLFHKVETCQWLALPSSMDSADHPADMGLFIRGIWESEAVRMTIRSKRYSSTHLTQVVD